MSLGSQVMLQDPMDLADGFYMLHEQKRSAWSHATWQLQGAVMGAKQWLSARISIYLLYIVTISCSPPIKVHIGFEGFRVAFCGLRSCNSLPTLSPWASGSNCLEEGARDVLSTIRSSRNALKVMP